MKSLVELNAGDVKNGEVDNLPEIVRIKALIAEKENERQAAVSRATVEERKIKDLSEQAARCGEEIRVTEGQQPALAAAALLDGDAAQKAFAEQEDLLNQRRQWLRKYDLAKPNLQVRARAAWGPAHSLGAAVVQLEEQVQELRNVEKLRIARQRMEGTEKRR